jgi:phage-related protein
MASTPQLLIKVLVDNKDARRDLDDLSKAFDDFGKQAAAAFAIAGAAVTAGINKSVHAFSDLHEATTATRELFGDAADGILDFAKKADTGLGLSQRNALEAAAQFGLFGKEAGLTGDELVKFSTTLVALGADLASFKNTSPEQALNAIGSALAGQIRPLRNYAVLLSAAAVEQEAFNMGLFSGKGEITANAKTLATYSLIMKQSTTQQGDFIRTSEDLANAERVFAAQVENATAALGESFYPIAKSTMAFMNRTMIPAINNAVEGFRVFFMVLNGQDVDGETLSKWAGPMLDAAKKVHDFYKDKLQPVIERLTKFLIDNKDAILVFAGVMTAIAVAVSAAAAAMYVFQRASRLALVTLARGVLTNPILLALAAIAALFVVLWQHSERFRDVVTGAFNRVKAAVQPLVDKIGELWNLFREKLPGIITMLANWESAALDAVHPLLDFFGKLGREVVASIQAMFIVLEPWTNKIKDLFSKGWDALFPDGVVAQLETWKNNIVNKLKELWDGFQENLPGIIRTVREWRDRFFAALPDILTNLGNWKDNVVEKLQQLWNGFKDKLPGVLTTLRGWKADFLAALPGVLTTLTTWKDNVVGKFDELKVALDPVFARIQDKWDEIKDIFGKADKPEILGGWVENIEGWRDTVLAEVAKLEPLLSPVVDKIVKKIGEIKSAFDLADKPQILGGWVENIEGWWMTLSTTFEEIKTKILEWKNTILGYWEEMKTQLKPAFDELKTSVSELWTELGKLKDSFKGVWEELKPMLEQLGPLVPLLFLLLIVALLLGNPLVAIAAAVVLCWTEFQTFRDVVTTVIGIIIRMLTFLIDRVQNLLEAFNFAFARIMSLWVLLRTIVEVNAIAIGWVIGHIWNPLWESLEDAWIQIQITWNRIWTFATKWGKLIADAVNGVWEPLYLELMKVWDRIKGFFSTVKISIPNPFQIGGNMAPAGLAPAPAVSPRAMRAAPASTAPVINNYVTVTHTGLGIDSPRLQRQLVGLLDRYSAREGPPRG